ncbi:MAG: ATP synthase F1 subunit gamma [Planctomycetes bacterium]|nr:ATP synthase F1 subunit gamma [Planctomycetota bacterium]MBI3844745.1 ATP synthase F1 subunit gamma [Planctomycetota bacterium]
MARARELKKRIKSVESTRKITRTMELVATSRLKRAQDRVHATRPYASKLREMLAAVAAAAGGNASHPLLRTPDAVKRSCLFVITANRGLCGAFNTNLIRLARTTLEEAKAAGRAVDLYVAGKKGIAFFRYTKVEMKEQYTTLSDKPSFDEAEKLAQVFIDRFTKSETDQVDVIYSHFQSAGRQVPVVERLLPVPKPEAKSSEKKAEAAVEFLFEPGPGPILDSILPLYVKVSLLGAMVDSQASEQSARRIAMKNATDNAGDLLRSLRLTYNKARQSQITQELAEIMGGVEALKG